jgi:hypothetical protein
MVIAVVFSTSSSRRGRHSSEVFPVRVLLCKRVVASDRLAFDAEREVELPFAPFVGLRLYETERVFLGSDPSEDTIREVAVDPTTGQIYCYFDVDDFRYEESGGHWSEKEVRQCYQDWTLKDDVLEPRKPKKQRTPKSGTKGRR